MKIKFIRPEKLLRKLSCLYYNGHLYYDSTESIKTEEEYINKILDIRIILIYTEWDIKKIDFNKYYNFNKPITLEELTLFESKNKVIHIELEGGTEYNFFGFTKNRYYELYDDELNLINRE